MTKDFYYENLYMWTSKVRIVKKLEGEGGVMPVNVCNELFCVYMEYPSLNKLSEDYILVAGQKVICKFWKTFDVKIPFNIPVDCGNLCNIYFISHKYHINYMPVYSLIYLACLHFVMNYCLLNYFLGHWSRQG